MSNILMSVRKTIEKIIEKDERETTEKEMFGNYTGPEQKRRRDAESALVDQWCRDHPDKVIKTAPPENKDAKKKYWRLQFQTKRGKK